MNEDTYEFECIRAELFGMEKPNQKEYEEAHAERLKREQEELEASEANLLETQDEVLVNTGGKLDELNSILSSTQQKLNRFKKTACGSLSNIFNKGSVDVGDGGASTSAAAAATANSDSNGNEKEKNSDNIIGDDLEEKQQLKHDDTDDIQPIIPTEKIRNATMDMQKKMTSHLDKLDSLLNKAENAEIALSDQTKQMRKMAK